jgi:CSLREA domain-containing protein
MRPRTPTRRLPLRLTDLETRVTPALSLHGPYTVAEVGQLSATGADAWQVRTSLSAAPAGARTYFDVDNYIPARLDETTVRDRLQRAPMLFAPGAESSSVELALPKPDGTFARFRMWEYSVMEPGYVDPNPTFRAYRGRGIDDPYATVHADVSTLGFHAQVLSPDGAWYVDPYWHMQTWEYVSYYRKDLGDIHGGGCTCALCTAAVAGQPTFTPGQLDPVGGTTLPPTGGGTVITPFSGANAGTTRSFRLALAATGEYTAVFGGTVAKAEDALKTAVNRINQVYFNELSILFGLVTNNSNLIYTNAATDPYTDGNTGLMVDENQSNVDSVIGDASYDIGHVVGGAGGGGFAPGRVGVSGQKGRGCTTAATPTGDAFWIDFLAHEFGHQFNAAHTFNGTATANAAQRVADHAYEPGSGTTIMAYAGIMGSDNIQANSDPYFHVASLDDIVAYVQSIPTVGTSTPNFNIAPTFGTPPTQVIPAGTPFFLATAGVGDSNGDSLTFCWEEKDLGPARPLGAADNGQSPLFRSFPPTTTSVRYFPRLDLWAAGAIGVGETLPTTNRTMNFELTVRDNHFNGGGYNSGGVDVKVVNTGQAFDVTSQKFGASWSAGSTRTVTWNVAGTTANGINTSTVRLSFSTDGLTYPIDLGTTANDGSHDITVPNNFTTTGRVKVQATNHNFFDINDGNITIAAGNLKGTSFAATPLPVFRPGREVKFDFSVTNADASPVPATDVGFYVSINPNPVQTGSHFGTVSIPALAGNETYTSFVTLQLPPAEATWIWNNDGTYYLGMLSDYGNKVNEVNEIDNFNQGAGIDFVAATFTQVRDDNYEQNDDRATASTALLNSPGVWLSSVNGMGVQHDLDYYKFVVPPQSTKYARVTLDFSYDPSTGPNNAILEAPPYYINSAVATSPGTIDFYGQPGDYYVYVASGNGYKFPTGNPYDLRWTAGPDLRGPQVVAVFGSDGRDPIVQNERLNSAVPGLRVEFNEPLTKSAAENPANWQLIAGGVDISGQISKLTYAEEAVNIVTKRYVVTLDLTSPIANGTVQLRALAGITDTDGNALGGNGDNLSGDPFIRDFRIFEPNAPGPEQGIAQIKGGNQRRPQVALNGSYVAVWESYGQEGDAPTESNIYARLYDDAGQPLAPEFRVNQYTTGEQSRPAVASDGKGNFIVTWQSLGQDGDGYGVYYREFKADGTSGSETAVNQFGKAGNQQNPTVAMNADGKFLIAYESNRQAANGYDIVLFGTAPVPGGSGDFFHNPFNQYTTGDQTRPAVAMDAVGNYVVAWQSAGQDGSGLCIVERPTFVIGYGTTASESVVNQFTAGDQFDPAVAASASGEVFITWTSAGQDGAGDGVYARRYQSLNGFVSFGADGPEFRVNQNTNGDQNSSAAAMDADGDAVITWQSQAQDGSGFGVYARRFSPTGIAQGNEFLANFYTTADQGSPSVAVDADGDYIVVWQSAGQDGSGDGVYGRTYSVPQPEVTGTFARVTQPGTAPYTFSVTIADNLAVNVATLGTGDIRVTGPNGFNTLATFVSVDNNTNGTPRVATYKFDPPGGSWGPTDNGIYSVLVEPNQIGDLSGNFAAAGTVGAIIVAAGGDYLVTNNADNGLGSLRQAIANANAAPGPQIVAFEPTVFNTPQTITLTTGEIAITDAVTIQGLGSALVTVSGNNAGRIFNTQPAASGTAINVEGITLTGGQVTGSGGAIIADDENLTVRNCALVGNQATVHGGAIFGTGSKLVIEDSTFSGNQAGARGGAVGVAGISAASTTIRRSTFSSNLAATWGGAVWAVNAVSVESSTLSGNTAKQNGGAVYLTPFGLGSPSTVLVSNSTLSGNSALGVSPEGVGGAITLGSFSGTATIQNSTIANNTATNRGGGLSVFNFGSSTVTFSSTILAGNSAATGPDVSFSAPSAWPVAGNNNLIGVADPSDMTLTGMGNLTGTAAAPLDAKLGPLAANGGPTQTRALLAGSPAIDAGSNPAGLTTDQRGPGFPRVAGKAADIGAFELPLQPLSLVVNTTADVVDANDGKLSLREAILAAEASNLAVVDTITFDPAVFNPGTITLNGTELPFITNAVTISGLGVGKVTINGAGKTRIFNTDMPNGESLTLSGLTLTNGKTIGNGGALHLGPNDNATVIDCVITGNTAISGGGIALAIDADLVLVGSTLSGNVATTGRGGGLYLFSDGSATVTGSTVSGNAAGGHGGGIYFWGTTPAAALTIRNSTFSGNSSVLWGGGIAVLGFDGSVSVQNSTFSGNSAFYGGAMSRSEGKASVTVESSILFGNVATTGPEIYAGAAPVTVLTSLMGTTAGISMLTADGFTLANVGVDPQLAPLAANGGPSLTHAIAYTSPAVNKGTNPAGLLTDQRGSGFARDVNGVDVGAFEVQAFPPPTVTSLVINGGAAQRSTVTSLKVTFDQPVTLPANPADAFQLRRQSDDAPVTLSAAVAGNAVTLTFAGGAVHGASLADGRYTLTAFAAKLTGPGGLLDGNGDGVAGDNYAFATAPPTGIFRLFGDVDGDGDVDATDFGAFRAAFGGTANLAFDFDNDGDVDAADFGQFRARFGSSV